MGGDNNDVTNIIRGLRWEDQFFREEEGVVAVFDFDYEEIVKFNTEATTAMLLFPPFLLVSSLFCYPCVCGGQSSYDPGLQYWSS